ncbi:MAG: dihydrolipoyl dehydrogenase [Oscillospiraceae bacterium]|nr:dihydrolipoyl dehydrogenase [Oscillospiraceae bacterium]MBO7728727.1 dihydrolipoyl dehydrogenase [Oscillospiraceae bacterium]MBP5168502.1 dihydrolipoyl dehydrogenase [Oscillospiraceae bacterium]
MADFDVIVIGAGPGGYLAAERAGQAGLKALLIEKQHIGGTCLNEGCIPTKTLLHSAKLYDASRNGKPYCVTVDGAKLDHQAVVARKRAVTANLVAGVKAGLKAAKVKTVEDAALIKGRDEAGFAVEAGGEVHHGKNLILAVGSHPIVPGIDGLADCLKSGFVLTSTELLEIPEVPASLCVIGGGVIGLEMATYFAMAGTKIEIVEAMGKVAGNLDADATAVIQKACEKMGMNFRLNTRAVSFADGKVTVEADGKREEIACEKALLCIGRAANLEGYGLETIHVPTANRAITVDEHCMTGIPGVYAVGDCNGTGMLAHVAYRQAEVAVNHIVGKDDPMRWACVPSLVHTEPEAAFVGQSVEEAKANGIDAVGVKLSMNYSGLYLAENENGQGIIKAVFDKKKKTMIGATIVGGPASELITICGIMIDNELPVERMKSYVFPHPTCAEAIREAIFAAKL